MIKGFKNFLLRGDVIVIAIGLIVALAFSTLIKAFTDSVIDPLISRARAAGRSDWVSSSARRATPTRS